jgi:hypothetical protein
VFTRILIRRDSLSLPLCESASGYEHQISFTVSHPPFRFSSESVSPGVRVPGNGCWMRRGGELRSTGQTLPHSSRVTGGPLSGRATRPRSLRQRLDHGSSGAPRLPGTHTRLSGDHSTSSLVKAPRRVDWRPKAARCDRAGRGNLGNPLLRFGAS